MMRRPIPKQSFGTKKQSGISRKADAMRFACMAPKMPSVEQLVRPPYSLSQRDAQDVIQQARQARGV